MKNLYYFSILVFLFALTSCDKKLDQPIAGKYNISGTVFLITDSIGKIDTTKIKGCDIRLGISPTDADDYILSTSTNSFGYFQFNKISSQTYHLWATYKNEDEHSIQQTVSINKDKLNEDDVSIVNIYFKNVIEETVSYRIEGKLVYEDLLTGKILPANDAQITYTRTSPNYEITNTCDAGADGIFTIDDLNFFDVIAIDYTLKQTGAGEVLYKNAKSDNLIVQDSVTILSPEPLNYFSGGDLLVTVIDDNQTPQNNFNVCLYSNRVSFQQDTASTCRGNYTDTPTNAYGKALFFNLPESGKIYIRSSKLLSGGTFLQTTDSIDLIDSDVYQFAVLDSIQ